MRLLIPHSYAHPGYGRAAMGRLPIFLAAAAAAVLVAAAPASAAGKKCGAYSRDDGSLASQVVTNIRVSGTSCSGGNTVAKSFHGQLGAFKSSGYTCGAYQGNGVATGSASCKKRGRKVTYTTAAMTSCPTTPEQENNFITDVDTWNTDCQTASNLATALISADNGKAVPVMGFTCNTQTFADSAHLFTANSCAQQADPTYNVVQVVYAAT
jgi:hypothetical protein